MEIPQIQIDPLEETIFAAAKALAECVIIEIVAASQHRNPDSWDVTQDPNTQGRQQRVMETAMAGEQMAPPRVVRNLSIICFWGKRPVLNSKTNVVVPAVLGIAIRAVGPTAEPEAGQIAVLVTRGATATRLI